MGADTDALALGQRVVAVLETGLRTATYKLALLMALVDHCVEHLPANEADRLEVPVRDLAERVIESYWRQVVPLAGFGPLQQSTQPRARIISAVAELRDAASAAAVTSVALARERVPTAYLRAVDDVALTLARQPLPRLQHVPGRSPGETFLYDDAWMHDKLSLRALDRHGGAISLYPGVGAGLARLSGLLRPTLELLWVDDVVRMNASLREQRVDLAGHLFGRERVPLGRVREAYFDEFGARCFYCTARLGSSSPVDHVLPWSRAGLDGLANLVAACAACNVSKSSALPSVRHMERALDRGRDVLVRLGAEIGWPVQFERTVGAARGLYLSSPAGTPLWESRSTFVSLPVEVSHGRVPVVLGPGPWTHRP